MKLSDLGERNAIELISSILSRGDAAVWIGDDCAALDYGDDYLLISTDMISQETHIPEEMTSYEIGWFVVAINLSDIAAKGGKPLGIVLSLGLPKNTDDTFLKMLIKGADACATTFDTSIIGGDTKENQSVTICGTAFGVVKKSEFMPRAGAKPGDIVAVTGVLGKAGAGYLFLKDFSKNQDTVKGLTKPIPRLNEGRALATEKIISSCMDISDGLSSSLYQLRELNHVGFEIDLEQLPIASELVDLQKKRKIEVYECALHFGGDYELLVTLSPAAYSTAAQVMKKVGTDLTPIGRVTASEDIMIVTQQGIQPLENKGYEHFKPHQLF